MFPVQCGVLPALEALTWDLCLPFSTSMFRNLKEAPTTGMGWELSTLMPRSMGLMALEGGCHMGAHRSSPLPRLPSSLALCSDARLGVSG